MSSPMADHPAFHKIVRSASFHESDSEGGGMTPPHDVASSPLSQASPSSSVDFSKMRRLRRQQTYAGECLLQRNSNLRDLDIDVLYHFGLDTKLPLEELVGDIKLVVMGGSAARMEFLAHRLMEALPTSYFASTDGAMLPLGKNERYSMFKCGPILSVNHGMGCPSMSILLHEVTKLLRYAGASDYTFIRLGTCGGIGVDPGTVCLTSTAVNGKLQPCYKLAVLGKTLRRDTQLDAELTAELADIATELNLPSAVGKTLCADCFYEGQARVDGALCAYSKTDARAFLDSLPSHGIINIEMETLVFSAFTKAAGVRAAVVAVALVDRVVTDQVTATPEQLAVYTGRGLDVVTAYCKRHLHHLRQSPSNPAVVTSDTSTLPKSPAQPIAPKQQ